MTLIDYVAALLIGILMAGLIILIVDFLAERVADLFEFYSIHRRSRRNKVKSQ